VLSDKLCEHDGEYRPASNEVYSSCVTESTFTVCGLHWKYAVLTLY